MSFTHVLLCVDLYQLTSESFRSTIVASGDRELRISGWFLSHASTVRMDAVFTSADAVGQVVIPIEHHRDPSPDIAVSYESQFGEVARACRFHHVHPIEDGRLDLSSGVLRVQMSDLVVIERALGELEKDRAVRAFSDEERALAGRFENLGENCEIGLFQRLVGFERMSLLRFAGVSDAQALADTIARSFDGFAEGDDLHVQLRDSEWIVNVASAALDIHSGRTRNVISKERLLEEERTKLQFLANKLLDDLESGDRIFVFRQLRGGRGGLDGDHGMDALYRAMCMFGGHPILLWVNEADEAHAAGTVIQVRERLFRGWMPMLTPYLAAKMFDADMWLEFLARAASVIDDVVTTSTALEASAM